MFCFCYSEGVENMSTSSSSGEINSDLKYLMTILMSQTLAMRPEDLSGFCHSFFDKIEACSHVVGQSFSTITKCRLNRRAFVRMCLSAFEQFPPSSLMTTFDHAILIRALCPNIATTLLHEIHFLITPLGKDQTRSYSVQDLNSGLYFVILFEGFLAAIKNMYGTDGDSKPSYINVSVLGNKFEELRIEKECLYEFPSPAAIRSVINDIETSFGSDAEVSYDTLRRTFVSNSYIRDELILIS